MLNHTEMHLCISYIARIYLMFHEESTFFHRFGPGGSRHQAGEEGQGPLSAVTRAELQTGTRPHDMLGEDEAGPAALRQALQASGRAAPSDAPGAAALGGERRRARTRWPGSRSRHGSAARPRPARGSLCARQGPAATRRGPGTVGGARPAADKARPRPAADSRSPPPRRRPAGPSLLASTRAANGHSALARGGS